MSGKLHPLSNKTLGKELNAFLWNEKKTLFAMTGRGQWDNQFSTYVTQGKDFQERPLAGTYISRWHGYVDFHYSNS